MDLSNKTIKDLFYKQIKELTLKTQDSFDFQFSGKLLEKEVIQMEEELLQEALPLPIEETYDKEEELDIYTEEGIEEYVDDDSISASEEGFMIGYLGA